MGKGVAVAIVSDLHSGSTVGLIPPGQWKLQEGGYYNPSPQQSWLFDEWKEAWMRFKQVAKRRKVVVIHNGDAIDGDHHGTNEIFTKSLGEQSRVHIECMDWVYKKVGWDKIYYVRGTESHVGDEEESIARDLDAVPESEGRYLHDQLLLTVPYGERPLLDVCHHGSGVGYRAWTRGNSFRAQLLSYYYELLDRGLDIPRYVYRSHMHSYTKRHIDDRFSAKMTGVVTGAWQLKTHYGTRVANMRLSDIMLSWLVVDSDRTWTDEYRAEIKHRKPKILEV